MTESTPLPDGYSLKGRNALVTGGGTHLGLAMARAVAAQGAQVTVLGRTERFLTAAVERLGPGHRHFVADLVQDNTYDRLLEDGTHFDIIVNNAGGDPHDGKWEEQTAEHWLYTYNLNVVSANRLAQTFVPGMKERGWGRIINIASVYGMVAPNPIESAARQGLRSLHRRQARDDRPDPFPCRQARPDGHHRQRRQPRHVSAPR